MRLSELRGKKILILGFAKEGMDTLIFLRKLLGQEVIFGIGDQLKLENMAEKVKKPLKSDKKLKLHLGANYLEGVKYYDIIIRSPGMPRQTIRPYLTDKQRITSQTEIFFANCPGKIVGVTGTKGKGTTASLIYRILKAGGIKAHLVGNIGRPVLTQLLTARKSAVYIYELSSHQLSGLKQSPHIAVFLNIYPEHLDYYGSFGAYLKAKSNIYAHQTKDDYLIYNKDNREVVKAIKASSAKKIAINPTEVKRIISEKDIPLKGKFNLHNVSAAIEVAKLFKIPSAKVKEAIKTFKPLPHRLEFVGTFKRIDFYNDSLATMPEAAISALNALGDQIQTLISGGFDRGLSFAKMAKAIADHRKIETMIFFPTTGKKIWQEMMMEIKKQKNRKLPRVFFVDKMREAVKLGYEYTEKGRVCLLSCGSASFGVFKDYRDRGNQFKYFVRNSGK